MNTYSEYLMIPIRFIIQYYSRHIIQFRCSKLKGFYFKFRRHKFDDRQIEIRDSQLIVIREVLERRLLCSFIS